MKKLFKITNIVSVLAVTLFFLSCSEDETILPAVDAGFTYTVNQDTGTVIFINISENATSYEWSFGDETTSTEINPIKTYANGTYTVILKAKHVSGASDTFEDIIVIGDGTGGGSTNDCSSETEESMSASDLNITFMSDQSENIINDETTFQWVANPSSDNTINTSCYVAKITKHGVNPWDNTQIDLDGKLDFDTNSGIKIKVYSETPGFTVLLKLEDQANSSINTELSLTTTQTNAWEELEFAFDSNASNKYDKLVLIFDLASANTNTYYFDDLTLYGDGSGGGSDCTAETEESMSASDLNITFMSDQTANIINDETTFEWVTNPDFDNTLNTSCFVGKVTKHGVNPWDNNQINLDAKLDFNSNSGIKIKVYSATPGFTVLMKLEEQANPAINTEINLTTTQTNAWEELEFSFASSESNKYDRIVLIFDLASANTNTYYFDDLGLYGDGGSTGGGGSSETFTLSDTIDFESDGFGANWAWNVFENADNPALEFVSNPVSGGINTSSTVAKITARQSGQPWVGTETQHGEMGITWDLSTTNAIIKIMVYKTVISDVGIKLVNANGGAQAEIKVANTVVNQWEELTFDFTSRIGNGLDGSTNIDQIVVFPDFVDARSSDTVTYFDNITFN